MLAVSSEPFSVCKISLIIGKIEGISSEVTHRARWAPWRTNRLAAQFPTDQNREFFLGNKEAK